MPSLVSRPCVLLVVLFLCAIPVANAATVTNTNDSGAGSLRDAIVGAASGETINFSLTLPATITLSSEIPITTSLNISGPGARLLTITTTGASRIFHLDSSGKNVTINGVTLTGGNATGNGGAILNSGGNLTIQFATLSGNHATGEGGAIYNEYNGAGNELFIQNSTIAGNSANKSGAIWFIGWQLVIENSTIAGNSAVDSSGAIGLFFGFSTIRNSTISGNSAVYVAGITCQDSQLTFESTIVSNNIDSTGTNDLNRTGNSTVNATASLFSEAFVPADNVINGTNTANQIGVDPQLSPLADNGGPTDTMRPQAGSPAIGAGSNSAAFAFDQRGAGFARDAGGAVDVGAIQATGTSDLAIVKSIDNANPTIGTNVVFTLTVTNNGPSDATGVAVNDPLPAGYTYVSDDGGGAYVQGTGVWTIGALANGASTTLHITATVNASGPYANTATVTANEDDPVGTNDSATAAPASVVPPSADLSVTKTSSAPAVFAGQTFDFVLTVTNNGPDPATNVVVTDPLPPNFSLISATPTQGSCTGTTTVTCNIGSMLSGASVTITISGTATSTATMTNTASVSATEADPTPGNNASTARVTVSVPAGIPAVGSLGLVLMTMLVGFAAIVVLRAR